MRSSRRARSQPRTWSRRRSTAPIRTGAASSRRRDVPARASTRLARACASATSSCTRRERRGASTARRSGGFSARSRSRSRAISGSARARRAPGGATSPRSTYGSMPNTPRSDVLVLKIGGSVGTDADAALDAVAALHDAGHALVVLHGGGPLGGEWAERLGHATRFVRGLRVTDEPTRDLALAVLGGLANARAVAALLGRGVPAVGLTGIDGGMLRAEREDAELGFVGRVALVDSALLEDLIDTGRVPVIAPAALARDDGEILNVNADAAAGAIAASLGARLLVFVTDVPGVRGKDGRVIARLDAARARALVDDRTIEGGMLPKVEACLVAAAAGCTAAIVASRGVDEVERLLAGEQVGTVFLPQATSPAGTPGPAAAGEERSRASTIVSRRSRQLYRNS